MPFNKYKEEERGTGIKCLSVQKKNQKNKFSNGKMNDWNLLISDCGHWPH